MENITKKTTNAGLVSFYPVIVLSDENNTEEIILDRDDYSDMRLKEGMSDRDIYNFAGAGMV